jgi:proteasome lid subunit RPN8/RPN11
LKLCIEKEAFDRMIEHLKSTYPEEGCGFLIGKENTVFTILPAENKAKGDRRRTYEIAPEDFVKAEKFARSSKFEVLGFYHSHPDVGLYFSKKDEEDAWEGYFYLVVSIDKEGWECGCWIKKKDTIEKIKVEIKGG